MVQVRQTILVELWEASLLVEKLVPIIPQLSPLTHYLGDEGRSGSLCLKHPLSVTDDAAMTRKTLRSQLMAEAPEAQVAVGFDL